MLRAGAKNAHRVTVLVDPADYQRILEEIKNNHGKTTLVTRQHLAQKTFRYLSEYDRSIADYLAKPLKKAELFIRAITEKGNDNLFIKSWDEYLKI